MQLSDEARNTIRVVLLDIISDRWIDRIYPDPDVVKKRVGAALSELWAPEGYVWDLSDSQSGLSEPVEDRGAGEQSLRERLAAYAHEAWSGWMEYLFSQGETRQIAIDGGIETKWLMPAWAFHRWQRQMRTPYEDLPEEEKESDRKEADKMLAIMASERKLDLDAPRVLITEPSVLFRFPPLETRICSGCEWVGWSTETVGLEPHGPFLLCPECRETTESVTPGMIRELRNNHSKEEASE